MLFFGCQFVIVEGEVYFQLLGQIEQWLCGGIGYFGFKLMVEFGVVFDIEVWKECGQCYFWIDEELYFLLMCLFYQCYYVCDYCCVGFGFLDVVDLGIVYDYFYGQFFLCVKGLVVMVGIGKVGLVGFVVFCCVGVVWFWVGIGLLCFV